MFLCTFIRVSIVFSPIETDDELYTSVLCYVAITGFSVSYMVHK